MPPQRKVDLVLDSAKRLLRVGATANLSNLLSKQHPADLAQIFSELPERDRLAAFSVLVERNSRLAMETLSELGPETGAQLLAGRSAEEIAKLVQELPSDDAAALIDNLPDELSAAVLELMGRKESGEVENLLEYPEQTAGRIMNPNVFALAEDMTVGEAITALQTSRDVEMVFYLYIVDARGHLVGVTSLRRLAAGFSRDAAQADHDARSDQRARRHGSGGGGASRCVLQPAGHSGRRGVEQARRCHHRG